MILRVDHGDDDDDGDDDDGDDDDGDDGDDDGDDDVHDGDDGEDEEEDDDEEEDEELARLILTSQFGRIHLLHCILRFPDFHVALHAVMSVALVFYI